ncbi:MAG: hypothetical protein DI611_15345 [Brachybacterium faecium]|nr:MAG: hypothetical protein DI611_15345 [Brachybacterium faecium]
MNALQNAIQITVSRAWDVEKKNDKVIGSGSGARFMSETGEEYIDFTSCTGAAPLGMASPVVRDATLRGLELGGMVPGTVHQSRVRVAEQLLDRFPGYSKAVFLRTGSCATDAAVKMARSLSGKPIVLTAGYHGWHDWQLQYQGSQSLAMDDPHIVHFGYDLNFLKTYLDEHENEVAAVIVSHEYNFCPIQDLESMMTLARDHGVISILDEVMTGFRVDRSGVSGMLGNRPDIVTLSKGLANATALSAVLLNESVEAAHDLANIGNTYMREVVPFEVASATLPHMDDAIESMTTNTAYLAEEANKIFREWNIPALCVNRGGIMHLIWGTKELRDSFYGGADAARLYFGTGGTIMPPASLTHEDLECAAQYFRDFAENTSKNATASVSTPELKDAFIGFCQDNFFVTDPVAEHWWKAHTADVGSSHRSPVNAAPALS